MPGGPAVEPRGMGGAEAAMRGAQPSGMRVAATNGYPAPQGLDPRFQQMVESGRMDPMQAAARNARAQAGMLPFQQQGAPTQTAPAQMGGPAQGQMEVLTGGGLQGGPAGPPQAPPGMAQRFRGAQPGQAGMSPQEIQQIIASRGIQQLPGMPPGAMTKPMFQPGPGLQMPQGGQMFSQLYGGQGLDGYY